MTSDYSDVFAQLESWYSRANGQYLLQNIRGNLERSLERAFGYHILQLGVTRQHALFEQSPINHRIYAAQRAGPGISLIAHCEELPLEGDSVDILIAHHSLEFEANPHRALREMQRVVAPQGHLFIVGFNPYSAFGVASYLRGRSRKSLWHQQHAVTPHRVTDWLRLLGCEVQDCSHLYSIPPIGGARVRDWMSRCDAWVNGHNIPLGGLYVLHAVKQVSGLNRTRRRLIPARERLLGLAVPTPGVVPSPSPAVSPRVMPLPDEGEVAA